MVSRRTLRLAGSATVALAALAGVAAAQQVPTTPNTPSISPVLSFAISLVFNLVVGGIAVAAAPGYLRRTSARVRNNPGSTLLWGLIAFIGLILASILIITLIVTIPALLVLGIVGNVIVAVVVGMAVTRSANDDNLFVPLAVGVLIISLIGLIPFLGAVVNFVLGMMGGGAMVNEFRDGR
ncbi:hypothetical protein AUR64_05085 [Haloprofundus marisrubri]|uniref:DUF8173 domain-containing protein n=1 Tax=Haloprofundus marisrubri TaxID=1514971 RepID=A0A0W1RD10_9EURY|nr:hypothetical protein [Haloprofundus marisrubri]KTG11300.1 hypothetical protein AUR64_05085 [Haloprofundus marisrubri]